jgi:hypothetical protein
MSIKEAEENEEDVESTETGIVNVIRNINEMSSRGDEASGLRQLVPEGRQATAALAPES